jgi:hypothetical protein
MTKGKGEMAEGGTMDEELRTLNEERNEQT